VNVHERMVTVAPDVDLRVLCSGFDGERVPFLLVHGLASNARTWDGVAAALAAAGHPVVAVDQRGHGRSTKPNHGYDFATVVGDLVVLIDQLGWHQPIVVGQSWGGNVVVELAATHPDALSAVAAVDGGFIELSERFHTWDECRVTLAPPHLLGTPASTIEGWMREANPDWPETGIVGSMANFEVREDGTIAPWLSFERHMNILEALYHHRPSTRFRQIAVPTLLVPADTGNVAWTTDKRAAVDAALSGLTHGRAHWFSPAHHDIHAQHPVELARVLLELAEETVPT
jgi:pimeloyl-ACP methyl ester carboxylesterase